MSRSPGRAAIILFLAAACSRHTNPDPLPAAALALVRPDGRPAGGAAATRVAPPLRTHLIRARPEPCLPKVRLPPPQSLADEARRALEAGKAEHALDCADEATRLAPRLVPALAARADALAALDRLDEARFGYARALAIDPENPVVLLGAADLYVRRLSDQHDALETGLEYARRGLRSATRAPVHDRELTAELQLVAAMAENDLGRNRAALGHLDRAMAVLPEDADVVYERGVALFELCRFEEAQRAFERALAVSPDDPWILHQLGLLAERRGDGHAAEQLLSRARRLDGKTFAPDLPMDVRAFRSEVERAISQLPPEERKALTGVPVEIGDLPDAADLLAVDPPLSPAILGLYRGPPTSEACDPGDGPHCRSIVFYRKNLIRFARTQRELEDQVRITLLHELGHLHGEDDQELRDRGLE